MAGHQMLDTSPILAGVASTVTLDQHLVQLLNNGVLSLGSLSFQQVNDFFLRTVLSFLNTADSNGRSVLLPRKLSRRNTGLRGHRNGVVTAVRASSRVLANHQGLHDLVTATNRLDLTGLLQEVKERTCGKHVVNQLRNVMSKRGAQNCVVIRVCHEPLSF